MTLLRLEPRDDADDLRSRLHPVFLGQGAARLGVVVAGQVDAVVDATDGRPGPAFLLELGLDHRRDRDQLVHVRCEDAQHVPVFLGSDPAGVNGRDDVRPSVADLAKGDRRARPDELGPVHVVMQDVGSGIDQVCRQRADGDRVVRLVDDEDVEARPLHLADGTPW